MVSMFPLPPSLPLKVLQLPQLLSNMLWESRSFSMGYCKSLSIGGGYYGCAFKDGDRLEGRKLKLNIISLFVFLVD